MPTKEDQNFYSAVFFDMDGLLINSEPLWLESETEMMAEFGYQWLESDQAACLGGPLDRVGNYMSGLIGGKRDGHFLTVEIIERMIEKFKGAYPILGVCLGHQAIGQAFGGNVVKTYPMHGKISEIFHQGKNLFKGLPSPFKATRYHSLIIEKETCPKNLEITATTQDGIIMGIADEKLKIFGVQFHPESIASEHGHQIIENFLGSF